MDQSVKENLALGYQIMAYLGYDDHTYTHLSARPQGADYFYILPFGLCFEELTADNLLKVDFAGNILDGSEFQYNRTGYIIHGSIYQQRSDLTAIFHNHTPYNVAVSAMREGLLPISQWALHFYNKISYHDYDSLALEYSAKLHEDLGSNFAMFLRNHGTITAGRTIWEAMFYTYHLEKACETQVLTLSTNRELIIPSKEICEKAVADLLSFEKDLGLRDWKAWERKVSRLKTNINNIEVAYEL